MSDYSVLLNQLSMELLLGEIIGFLFLSLTISFGSFLFARNLFSLILLNICTFGRSCFLCSGSLWGLENSAMI